MSSILSTVISFVDVPGHEKFVRHMVAGATGIEAVLLVVAADQGIQPQTREHLEICSLLGLKRGIVAISKSDLVDPDLCEVAALEVQETHVLEVSGETGIRAAGDREPLLEIPLPERASNLRFGTSDPGLVLAPDPAGGLGVLGGGQSTRWGVSQTQPGALPP